MKERLIALLLFGVLALGFAGCATLEEDPNSQETPWSQPASWEGQMPGMPGSAG